MSEPAQAAAHSEQLGREYGTGPMAKKTPGKKCRHERAGDGGQPSMPVFEQKSHISPPAFGIDFPVAKWPVRDRQADVLCRYRGAPPDEDDGEGDDEYREAMNGRDQLPGFTPAVGGGAGGTGTGCDGLPGETAGGCAVGAGADWPGGVVEGFGGGGCPGVVAGCAGVAAGWLGVAPGAAGAAAGGAGVAGWPGAGA
jgi:hypothetical protein